MDMNIDELAEAAAAALAERLAAGVTDTVTTLIGDRLRASKTGSRALALLGLEAGTELAASGLADELQARPRRRDHLRQEHGRRRKRVQGDHLHPGLGLLGTGALSHLSHQVS